MLTDNYDRVRWLNRPILKVNIKYSAQGGGWIKVLDGLYWPDAWTDLDRYENLMSGHRSRKCSRGRNSGDEIGPYPGCSRLAFNLRRLCRRNFLTLPSMNPPNSLANPGGSSISMTSVTVVFPFSSA